MSKQKDNQQKEEAQAADNPDVVIVKAATAPKLSPRGEGGIGYQVGRVGRDVYIRIEKNDGGGSFSREWVPVEKIRAAITPAMTRGEPFKSDALAAAYVGKSQCNSGFLVAALRAEQVFGIDAERKGMSVLTGGLDAWERQMRDAEPVLGDDGQPVTVKLRPEPKDTRFRKAEPASEESPKAEGEGPSQEDIQRDEDAKPKRRTVRISKSIVESMGLAHAVVPPEGTRGQTCETPEG